MQLHRPDTPGTTTGKSNPETSRTAAERALGRSGTRRWQVLMAILDSPSTDEELQDRLRMGPNTQRPRRVELMRSGYVVDSGQRRKTEGGNPSIVWEVSENGRWMLEVLLSEESAVTPSRD